MSAGILYDFFPDLTAALKSHTPALWQHIFPDAIQTQCPELAIWVAGTRIRNPGLLPIMLVACIVGFAGCLRLRKSGVSSAACSSYFCFACMNAVASVCHCFTTPLTPTWELFAGLDACFTGCSAVLGCAAFCMRPRDLRRFPNMHKYIIAAVFAGYILGRHAGTAFVREVVYLLITLTSAAGVGIATAQTFTAGLGTTGLVVACVGVLLSFSGLGVDKYLCQQFGSAVDHMHLLFTGCVVIFWGFEEHLTGSVDQAVKDE
jgi:hypothetical protein